MRQHQIAAAAHAVPRHFADSARVEGALLSATCEPLVAADHRCPLHANPQASRVNASQTKAAPDSSATRAIGRRPGCCLAPGGAAAQTRPTWLLLARSSNDPSGSRAGTFLPAGYLLRSPNALTRTWRSSGPGNSAPAPLPGERAASLSAARRAARRHAVRADRLAGPSRGTEVDSQLLPKQARAHRARRCLLLVAPITDASAPFVAPSRSVDSPTSHTGLGRTKLRTERVGWSARRDRGTGW
jgi:hypothetical protein